MSALQNLLVQSIDYAGLFPPAGLSMQQSVANFAAYTNSPARSMLGRIVVPAGRLAEMAQCTGELPNSTNDDTDPWRISALVPPINSENQSAELKNALAQISAFNDGEYFHRKLKVDSVEIKINSPIDVALILETIPPTLQTFLEIDCQSDPTLSLQSLAQIIESGQSHGFAKIRTGSVVAEQIPSIEQVARFIGVCARNNVPFKATAGLHHPLRNEYRLTYEEHPPCGMMHGFLNVFVATSLAFEFQLENETIEQILAERSFENFCLANDRIGWGDRFVSSERVIGLRKRSIQSFGSCSFDEPTQELSALQS